MMRLARLVAKYIRWRDGRRQKRQEKRIRFWCYVNRLKEDDGFIQEDGKCRGYLYLNESCHGCKYWCGEERGA